MSDIRELAIAAGFDPALDFHGYPVEVLSAFILRDEKLWAEMEKNFALEIAGCPESSPPDDVLLATVQSFSGKEKASLRFRVKYALEKWDAA